MDAFLKTGKLGPSAKSGSSTKPNAKKAPKPWVEKYRPKKMTDVVEQEDVVAVLSKSMKRADLPNLLFYGPPGTGKTSTILAAARELYGNEAYQSRVLELNASDERGIAVVREKVKTFAQNAVSDKRPDGSPCPPFKLIILDEADSMTQAAQAALRRTMEKQSKTTRFCLICNYISRIIEPLTSRCSKFRFRPLRVDMIEERLKFICTEENVNIAPDACKALIDICEGDLRKAITTLQSVARLGAGEQVTSEQVQEITGLIPSRFLSSLRDVSTSGNVDKVQAFLDDFMMEGFAASQLLLQLHEMVLEDLDLHDDAKAEICLKIAIVDHKLLEGADEYLQLLDLATVLMAQFSKRQ